MCILSIISGLVLLIKIAYSYNYFCPVFCKCMLICIAYKYNRLLCISIIFDNCVVIYVSMPLILLKMICSILIVNNFCIFYFKILICVQCVSRLIFLKILDSYYFYIIFYKHTLIFIVTFNISSRISVIFIIRVSVHLSSLSLILLRTMICCILIVEILFLFCKCILHNIVFFDALTPQFCDVTTLILAISVTYLHKIYDRWRP